MEPRVFLEFSAATAIMIALPGPSLLLAIAHSISFGWRRALATVAGATAGIAVQLLVAAVGIGSLLKSVAAAFEWIRWAGAAYLVYLGIRLWISARKPLELDAPAISRRSLFVQGLVVTIPNPKSLIFIAAFLPQFIDKDRALGAQFSIIIPTFLAITFAVTAVWTVMAGKARGFLRQPRSMQFMLWAAGALMIVSGAGLALARAGSG